MTEPYRIELTRDALRTLAKLDKPVRRRIQGGSTNWPTSHVPRE